MGGQELVTATGRRVMSNFSRMTKAARMLHTPGGCWQSRPTAGPSPLVQSLVGAPWRASPASLAGSVEVAGGAGAGAEAFACKRVELCFVWAKKPNKPVSNSVTCRPLL